jgi:hypothetical protein
MDANVVGMMRSAEAPHSGHGAGWSDADNDRMASKTLSQLSQ